MSLKAVGDTVPEFLRRGLKELSPYKTGDTENRALKVLILMDLGLTMQVTPWYNMLLKDDTQEIGSQDEVCDL